MSAAGLPGVVIGHNHHIAWGFTNVGPDVQDLYVEKFDPANPQRYLTIAGHEVEGAFVIEQDENFALAEKL